MFVSKSRSKSKLDYSYPRSEEEEQKTGQVWLKGHTGASAFFPHLEDDVLMFNGLDFGSITILYSQPVAALQILSPDGKWRWIRHIPNALVCSVTIHGDSENGQTDNNMYR